MNLPGRKRGGRRKKYSDVEIARQGLRRESRLKILLFTRSILGIKRKRENFRFLTDGLFETASKFFERVGVGEADGFRYSSKA